MGEAAPEPVVVDHVDALTPEWLTAALRSGGLDVTVTAVEHRPVGTGQMAESHRLGLTYDGDAQGPATVVAKVPAAGPESRAAGAAGGYANEVGFYRDIADTVTIRVPGCHYAALGEDPGEFVLLLEDLAPGAQGDQLQGCSIDQARAAVETLAGLHGPRWCDPTLFDIDWIQRVDPETALFLGAIMQSSAEGFVDRYRDRMMDDDVEMVRAFAAATEDWVAARSERFGLVHGDYRLDNLLFATAEGGSPAAAVDWQTLGIGLPGRDLAYFLGNGLLPDDRRAHERHLVETYHRTLVATGVVDYSVDVCWEDYRFGQFQGPLITVLGAMHVEQTTRGDDMFMAMITRAGTAIRDLDSLDLL
jgi:hypothetical protein